MLLKLGTEPPYDLKYWVTRRYFRLLWTALVEALERHLSEDRGLGEAARRAVLAMRQQEKLASTDFSQPFRDVIIRAGKAGAAPAPSLYPLLHGVALRQKAPGAWAIDFILRDRQRIGIGMDDEIMLSLCALMQKTLAAADWDLRLRGLESVVLAAAPKGGGALH